VFIYILYGREAFEVKLNPACRGQLHILHAVYHVIPVENSVEYDEHEDKLADGILHHRGPSDAGVLNIAPLLGQ